MESWGEEYDNKVVKRTLLASQMNHTFALKVPKVPTEAEVNAKAKTVTKAELASSLKDLKSLLSDPDEFIEPAMRTKFETLYKTVSDKISSSSVDTEEFFNHNHGRGGLFTSGPGGGGGENSSPSPNGVEKAESEKPSQGEKSPKGEAHKEGSIVSKLGSLHDPLNKYDATAKEATIKASKATASAIKWSAVAVMAAYGALAVGSAVATGLAVGAVAVVGLRVVQAIRHSEQAKLLERQTEEALLSPIG